MTHEEFITSIAASVKKYAESYGILVHSPIIAQAILESAWGESKLAAVYHNYFGLKCGTKWKGRSVNLSTMEEYTPGTLTKISDNFRVFDSMDDGVKGYFEFIRLARYQNLKGITDPRKYIETIKADGYATSSTYVDNNMKIINQYNLTRFDEDKEAHKMGYTRAAVVNLVNSWLGKNEADGSYKSIIDLYNSMPPFPRGTKMQYGWAWCACTWSAAAKKLGYTAIMPVEISCYYLIEEAKKMGCWQEADGYIPNIGDAVLYDWEDTGAGDNTGNPDHVGTVTYVNKDAGYFVVTEGNASNMVKKRTVSINGRFIRGFITPHYDAEGAVSEPTQGGGKSIDTVAHEVIAGQWGNGSTRTADLKAKGYDPVAVQNRVNEILNGSAAKPKTVTPNQPTAKKVTATAFASKYAPTLAGTYRTTANLYLRNDAGTNKRALALIPRGTQCRCYGYYTPVSGVNWLLIQVGLNGTLYTGFSSSQYLAR
ncbi:MAG: glucosaminidase domain-containing protein [Bilifractor sp.]